MPEHMSDDDADMYWSLLAFLIAHVKPTEYSEYVLLRDYAMLDLDVLKYRRMKTALVEKCRRDALLELFILGVSTRVGKDDFTPKMKQSLELHSLSLRTEKDMIAELSLYIAESEITLATQTAQRLAKDSETIANLEKLTAGAERRRNTMMAELTRGRQRKARLEKLLKLSEAFAEQQGWGGQDHSLPNDDTSPDSGQPA
jgi:hypothetical protein